MINSCITLSCRHSPIWAAWMSDIKRMIIMLRICSTDGADDSEIFQIIIKDDSCLSLLMTPHIKINIMLTIYQSLLNVNILSQIFSNIQERSIKNITKFLPLSCSNSFISFLLSQVLVIFMFISDLSPPWWFTERETWIIMRHCARSAALMISWMWWRVMPWSW